MSDEIGSQVIREAIKHCFYCYDPKFYFKNSDIFAASLKFLVSDPAYKQERELFCSIIKKFGDQLLKAHTQNEGGRQLAYNNLRQEISQKENLDEETTEELLQTQNSGDLSHSISFIYFKGKACPQRAKDFFSNKV